MSGYALYQGREIKIGTAEELLYLRADQAHLVTPVSCRDAAHALAIYCFRFPWPDEDNVRPGAFAAADRSLALPGIRHPPRWQSDMARHSLSPTLATRCALPARSPGRFPTASE